MTTSIFDWSVALATALFLLLGGLTYHGPFGGHALSLEFGDWGLALVPAAAVLLGRGPVALRASGAWRLLRLLWNEGRRFGSRHPALLLAAVLAPGALLLVWAMLSRHWAFKSDWDLAIYAQACHNGLYSSLRDETTLLADHFEPLLAAFVPLCRSFDAADVLLVVAAGAWAAGAVGTALLARSLRWSWPLSAAAGAAFLLFSGNRLTYFYDFHLVSLAGATLPWLFVALVRRRWGAFLVLAVVHAGLKESCALTLAALGLWMAVTGGGVVKDPATRRVGALTVILAGSAFLLIMQVAFPYFRGGRESLYFAKYYGYLGTSLGDMLRQAVLHPVRLLSTLATWDRLRYVALVLLPFAGAPLLRPAYLLPLVPAFAVNLLASNPYLYSGRFHYEAELYPLLFCLALLLSRDPVFLRRWRRFIARPLSRLLPGLRQLSFRTVWAVIFLAFFSGKAPSWYLSAYPASNLHETLRAELPELVAGFGQARVAAFETLAPHLSALRNLYLLDRWAEADWIVVAYPNGKGGWLTGLADFEQKVVPQLAGRFDLVRTDQLYPMVRVWKRKPQPGVSTP